MATEDEIDRVIALIVPRLDRLGKQIDNTDRRLSGRISELSVDVRKLGDNHVELTRVVDDNRRSDEQQFNDLRREVRNTPHHVLAVFSVVGSILLAVAWQTVSSLFPEFETVVKWIKG